MPLRASACDVVDDAAMRLLFVEDNVSRAITRRMRAARQI